MAGPVATETATMVCPHGGVVQGAAGGRVLEAGSPVLTSTDNFVVSGCPNTSSVGTPSPCVTVRWQAVAGRVRIAGSPVLTAQAPGVCLNADGQSQGQVALEVANGRVTAQ